MCHVIQTLTLLTSIFGITIHTCSPGVPTSTTTGSGATPTTTASQTPPPSVQPAALQQMLAQALQAQAVSGGVPTQPPPGGVGNATAVEVQQLQQAEVLYQSQLEQLSNMGFPNRQANLRGGFLIDDCPYIVCHVIVM